MKIKNSELIINPDGSVYHLGLKPDMLAETIITVGDPERVKSVTKHFSNIEYTVNRREFCTQTGTFKGKRITVISTGIGTDNIDIVFNELDALINVDFETRLVNKKLKSLDIIRLGTSGTVVEDIDVNTILISAKAIGFGGLLNYYKGFEYDESFVKTIQDCLELNYPPPVYLTDASEVLMNKLGEDCIKGITLTCPGFYAPQGRAIRLASNLGIDFTDKLSSFSHEGYRVTNMEMETSGIYGLGALLGHNCLSVNAILANRKTGIFSKTPSETVEKMIQIMLERIVK